ncbi:hypothetical protein Cadr_000015475 [Camelus dromedarius]|uniref:Uncharacterized protein n=1 Tax=Camelus dromedarius TaxID=9838 RepID=A0A5N4DPL0_CAMDR|nr:hypothetical protein Cadr_000015475 [Camelus dromedarius]
MGRKGRLRGKGRSRGQTPCGASQSWGPTHGRQASVAAWGTAGTGRKAGEAKTPPMRSVRVLASHQTGQREGCPSSCCLTVLHNLNQVNPQLGTGSRVVRTRKNTQSGDTKSIQMPGSQVSECSSPTTPHHSLALDLGQPTQGKRHDLGLHLSRATDAYPNPQGFCSSNLGADLIPDRAVSRKEVLPHTLLQRDSPT